MTHKTQNHEQADLRQAREQLAGLTGQQYWRSLEELANTEAFQERLHREFPQGAAEWNDSISRRNFLKLMGASMALAGVVGCTRQPEQKILPYTNRPEYLIPGIPQHYATAMTLGGYAVGLLVESHLGRPTKIEGNPDHPASLGATDAFGQATVLTLYDPDRGKLLTNQGQTALWGTFVNAVSRLVEAHRGGDGAGIRILTETTTSPTLISQINTFLQAFPNARWHQYSPLARDNARLGAQLAFGEANANTEAQYNLLDANVIVTLDADLLGMGPWSVRYAREYAENRRPWETGTMNRLYAVEASPSITGSVADHRLPVQPSQVEAVARLIAQQLGIGVALPESLTLSDAELTWIVGLINDLEANRGASVVVPGDEQPPAVHALAHAINNTLGNVGSTVFYTDSPIGQPNDGTVTQLDSLRALNDDMAAGNVDLLIIIGGNPAFTAPTDFNFGNNLANVNFTAYMGLYRDETAQLCRWFIPRAHELEAWSDARAYDGTVSIIQPLIAPLYEGKTAHELLAALNGEGERSSYDIVQAYWQSRVSQDFDQFWFNALHNGVVPGTSLPVKNVSLNMQSLPTAQASSPMELVFRPSPSVWDGSFANNGWLQELPQPWTRLTWDNAALMSPRTAIELLGLSIADTNNLTPEDYEALDNANGSVIELNYGGRTLLAPVWILPGHAPNAVTLHVGYGHTDIGQIGNGVGVNAYSIRSSEAPWFGPVSINVINAQRYPLVSTQDHHSMEGRAIVRAGTLEEYQQEPGFIGALAELPNHPDRSLFQDLFPYQDGYSWGMVIDLNVCIGCNTCTIACQAENNIPVVGKEEVAIGREMHWIRVDRYYGGDLENPVLYQQPMACVNCELAPCEIVCPVAATIHDAEGINNMIYNRCVGTRYCSNNCPYKVRRFNFFYYTDYLDQNPSLQLQQNPDVTVRSRGVMEKCTYCIQRIKEVTIPAKNENREITDGEVIPACAQACPTQAITFGNLNDQNSKVSVLKTNLLNYGVLEELNFFPRTTYLGRVTNPNPIIGAIDGAEYPRTSYPYGTEHDGGHSDESESHEGESSEEHSEEQPEEIPSGE